MRHLSLKVKETDFADLQSAIILASNAHAKQFDKAGQPYVNHLLRVMSRMDTEEEMIAAVLHDIVKDTVITLSDLSGLGFSDKVVKVVDFLTRPKGVTYCEYIERICLNETATKIKLADIYDNMDADRLSLLPEHDAVSLTKKYLKALKILTGRKF